MNKRKQETLMSEEILHTSSPVAELQPDAIKFMARRRLPRKSKENLFGQKPKTKTEVSSIFTLRSTNARK